MRRFSVLLLIFGLFGGWTACTPAADSDALDVRFTETLRLGSDDPDAPDHALFTLVSAATTDTAGRIYLTDVQSPTIRVYERDGTFLRSIGQGGSGPGEFESIGALHVDRHGRLLVADRSQARITAFTRRGELIDTYPLPDIQRITQVHDLSDGRFLVVGAHDGHLVHVVDADFEAIEASLAPIDEARPSDEELGAMWLRFSPGHVQPLGSDAFVYAPSAYAGQLYRYERNAEGTWHRTEAIEGFTRHDAPVTFTAFDRAERVDVPFTTPEGRYAGQFHVMSQGLFQMPDGPLVHVSMQEAGDRIDLLAEFFDADGTYRGYAVIDTTSSHDLQTRTLDDDGALYLSDTRDVPRLRRVAVELE